MTRGRTTRALVLAAGLALVGCGGDDGDSELDTSGDPGPSTATSAPDGTAAPGSGAISVEEAAALAEGSSATVRGYVFQPDEGATVMCDVLGESFPPTCVGPTLNTDGLDVNSLPGLETTAPGDLVAAATWTSAPVEVSGEIGAGRLVVSS